MLLTAVEMCVYDRAALEWRTERLMHFDTALSSAVSFIGKVEIPYSLFDSRDITERFFQFPVALSATILLIVPLVKSKENQLFVFLLTTELFPSSERQNNRLVHYNLCPPDLIFTSTPCTCHEVHTCG